MTVFNFKGNIISEWQTTNDQVVFMHGGTMGVNANLTRYVAISGGTTAPTSTESDIQAKIQESATLTRMRTSLTVNTVTLASTLNLRKNAANGNLTISITASTTGIFEDIVNSDSLSSGDLIDYQIITGATGTAVNVTYVMMLYTAASGVAAVIPVPTLNLLGVG